MVYINGIFYTKEEAKVSVYDHGYLYGDGIFEGIRIYNGKIFRLHDHITRLFESARGVFMDIGLSPDEMEGIVLEGASRYSRNEGYIRLVVSRGEGLLGIDPQSCKKATIVIIYDGIQLFPKEYYEKGIALITSSWARVPVQSLDTHIKSLNYLNNILAKIEARRNGCFESIMLTTEGFVCECTTDNIFIIKNKVIKTPSLHHGCLDGITRKTVMELAIILNITVQEATLTRNDLYCADECFLTGTGAEIMPVASIDGAIIGTGEPGNITKKIINAYREIVNAYTP